VIDRANGENEEMALEAEHCVLTASSKALEDAGIDTARGVILVAADPRHSPLEGEFSHVPDQKAVFALSDSQLVATFASGDQAAFAEICRRHQPAMLRLASQVCGPSDAHDVMQTVLEKFWQHPETFVPARGSLRTFLLTRTRTRAIDLWRSATARRDRETRIAADRGGIVTNNVESDALAYWTSRKMTSYLAELPPVERQAIVLAYLGDNTYRQVAELLGRPEGTTKSHIRRGLRRLRSAMGSPVASGASAAWRSAPSTTAHTPDGAGSPPMAASSSSKSTSRMT
jgi:RNA polymerase sigma-70 factor (ECF subfamily)